MWKHVPLVVDIGLMSIGTFVAIFAMMGLTAAVAEWAKYSNECSLNPINNCMIEVEAGWQLLQAAPFVVLAFIILIKVKMLIVVSHYSTRITLAFRNWRMRA